MSPSVLPGTGRSGDYAAPTLRIVLTLPDTGFARSNTEAINDGEWEFEWDQ
jgi:hypothetical protein